MTIKSRPIQPPEFILITGCSSGIGYHAAHHLKSLGYQVIATCRQAQDVQPLSDEGFISLQLDLADPHSVAQGWQQALELAHGQIAALFNNGAFGLPGALEDIERAALEHQFATNVFGTQQLSQLAIKQMRQQGYGRIIYNSSVLGFAAMAYRGAYNASKFALEGLADTLRIELRHEPINIVLIQPGPIESKFRANALQQHRQWVNGEDSAHKANYQAMIERLEQQESAAPFALGPEAVSHALVKALQAKSPRAHYRITLPTHLFYGLKRLLPTSWLDAILHQAGGGGKR